MAGKLEQQMLKSQRRLCSVHSTDRTPWARKLPSAFSAAVFDKPDMAEIEKFNKQKLKTEMQEKNPLTSKEMIELEKQTGESQ
ncbi:thymosin beta-4-like [Cynocephalus volans]|uniref:thymosin beta-4-like n=1 Tax=Cynocephalus volans TaxID=110931 RepID=UPI002FC8EDD9